jgi:MOSC domain-containing protein YiiM
MRVISVNVGLPRLLTWRGATFDTGIFKESITGRVMLRTTNLDGDRQADLSVHGGANKAVYGYPSEHYDYWRKQLPGVELPWGAFGENFTIEGLLESDVCVGDEYRLGGSVVAVTTPRLPCFKLAAKFRRDDIIERFLRSGRSGYYFSVVQEGKVGAGDEVTLLKRADPCLTIEEMADLYVSRSPDLEVLERALRVKNLSEGWRQRFEDRLTDIRGEHRTV